MPVIEHISAETVECYNRRELGATDVLRVQTHIGECAACRTRLAAVVNGSSRTFAGLKGSFGFSDFADELEHLPFEQLESFVDGRLDEVEREIVTSHLAVCAECARDLSDLTIYQRIAAAEPAFGAVSTATSATPRKTFWQQFFAFNFSNGLAPAFGALAILIAVLFGAWLVVRRNQTYRTEIARGNPNEPQPAQPSPAPLAANPTNQESTSNVDSFTNSISPDEARNQAVSPSPKRKATPAPKQNLIVSQRAVEAARSAAPLVALNDAGERIEFDANGDLRGLNDLPVKIRNAVRRSLQTGRVQVPSDARNLSNNRTGVLMSGEGSDGVPFALAAPVGKTVRGQQPTLRWKPLAGATRYKVAVVDQNFRVVSQSPEITQTEWTIPVALPRGATYSWQVTAVTAAGEESVSPRSPAPQARFRVLDQTAEDQLDQLEKSGTKSRLARGTAFANAGLLDEAQREFEILRRENPKSNFVRRLLADK